MQKRSAPVPSPRYVWLVCGLAVLVLDTVGSLAARHWPFPYQNLSGISYIIYFCAGVGGGRLAGIWAGGIAGGVTALADATLGRAISIALGVVEQTGPPHRALGVALVVAIAVLTGWAMGLLGGLLGQHVHRAFDEDA
ncbi:MAG: hypothetical protein ACTHM9_16905 [Gemmatimonadales bacterium]